VDFIFIICFMNVVFYKVVSFSIKLCE